MADQASVDDYFSAAEAAFQRRAFGEALVQISAALSFDPSAPRCRELMLAIVASAPNPLRHLEASGEQFFALMAVRAEVLARMGKVGDATSLLFRVASFRPRVSFLPWVRPWLTGQRSLRGVRNDGLFACAARLLSAPSSPENRDTCLWLLARVAAERPPARREATLLASQLARRNVLDGDEAPALYERVAPLLAGLKAEDPLVALEQTRWALALGAPAEALGHLERARHFESEQVELLRDLLRLTCELEQLGAVERLCERCARTKDPRAVDDAGAARDFVLARSEPGAARPLERLAHAGAAPEGALARWAYGRSALARRRFPPLGGAAGDAVRRALLFAAKERPPAMRLRLEGAEAVPRLVDWAFARGLEELGLPGGAMDEPHDTLRLRASDEGRRATGAIERFLTAPEPDLDAWARLGESWSTPVVESLLSAPPLPSSKHDPATRAVLALAALMVGAEEAGLPWLRQRLEGPDVWESQAAMLAIATRARVAPGRAEWGAALWSTAIVPASDRALLAAARLSVSPDDVPERVVEAALVRALDVEGAIG